MLRLSILYLYELNACALLRAYKFAYSNIFGSEDDSCLCNALHLAAYYVNSTEKEVNKSDCLLAADVLNVKYTVLPCIRWSAIDGPS